MSRPESALPEPAFEVLVDQFFAQGLIQLGEVPNPLTQERTVAPARAHFTIRMLEILREKTQGNLEPAEEQRLESAILELMSRYARATA